MTFGERLRDLRVKNKLSLDALAKRSGVSKGMLSHIERDKSLPTVRTLQRIAKGFRVALSDLLSEREPGTLLSDGISSRLNAKGIALVRREKRKKVIVPPGIWYEMLCPDLQHKIELICLHYPVGTTFEETYLHEGEECGVVLKGKLKGIIGDQVVTLDQGDSIYYESSIPHRWENAGDKEATAIWAITPPSF